ncbi:MAG: hypothetical protein GY762_08620, partial [Proteobacteria bacterium]|nr:hypothetical protein [Pseudomonadota bacterium]
TVQAVYGTLTYDLDVRSSPATGVGITVTPDDNSGNGAGSTEFLRRYDDGTEVTLTAPATYDNKYFSKWTIDGVDNTNRTIQVTIDSNLTVICYYSGVVAIPASERAALIAFYNSTNGDNWKHNTNWKGNNNEADGFSEIGTEGTWQGVGANAHVGHISLASNSLTGTLPQELENLTEVTLVYLHGNPGLTGSFDMLWKLKKLYSLYLFDTNLSGTLPPEVSDLRLGALWISGVSITGSLPHDMTGFYQNCISRFHIDGCGIRGRIPDNIGIDCNDEDYFQLGLNSLYTNDAAKRNRLNSLEPGWEAGQKIEPINVTAEMLSPTSVRITWTQLTDLQEEYGTKVYYSTTPGGPWTYSGRTADLSVETYDVTGLIPGTTYYFVAKTQTAFVLSGNSKEVSADTAPGAVVYSLSLRSSPGTGVEITVSPDDNNAGGDGTTNFTRVYDSGTDVSLTAPETYDGSSFLKWTIDDVDNINRSIQITMDSNHTVQAVYGTLTYDLDVRSSPATGVGITVTPDDNSGNGAGSTEFLRRY